MAMMMWFHMILMGIGNLSGLVGVRERHKDSSWDLRTVVGGQVEEVVGSGNYLGVDLINGEAGVVSTELSIDASKIVVHKISSFLGNLNLFVSAWNWHFSFLYICF